MFSNRNDFRKARNRHKIKDCFGILLSKKSETAHKHIQLALVILYVFNVYRALISQSLALTNVRVRRKWQHFIRNQRTNLMIKITNESLLIFENKDNLKDAIFKKFL